LKVFGNIRKQVKGQLSIPGTKKKQFSLEGFCMSEQNTTSLLTIPDNARDSEARGNQIHLRGNALSAVLP